MATTKGTQIDGSCTDAKRACTDAAKAYDDAAKACRNDI